MGEMGSSSRSNGAEIILDCISDGVITIDLQKRVTFLNRAMQKMLGYNVDAAGTLLACDVLIQSNICSTKECVLERALQGERVSNFEAMVRRRDGVHIPVSINTDFLLDKEGKLIGLIEVIRDISLVRELSAKVEEVSELKHRLGEQTKLDNMVGRCPRMQDIMAKLPIIAASKSSVLITGESGTGKELIACALHAHSPRKHAPFVVVNCSSLSEGILESEIFGHVKGAFTNAYFDKPGRFKTADGGSLFLDEVGSLSPNMQVKLLRVLEEREVRPVGAIKTFRVDVRILAACNSNLQAAVEAGQFREDLYYRLNVISIFAPPLRERREDIALLANHFIQQFNADLMKNVTGMTVSAAHLLVANPWKGNVRELRNAIEHAMILTTGTEISAEDLPLRYHHPQQNGHVSGITDLKAAVNRFEREHITKILQHCDGDKKTAAEKLGLSLSSLYRKMSELNISDG